MKRIDAEVLLEGSWRAFAKLVDAFWSSTCDSEAFEVLQSGERELLEALWGTLGTPLGSTCAALGSFSGPLGHIWEAFEALQIAKADFLKIIVFL